MILKKNVLSSRWFFHAWFLKLFILCRTKSIQDVFLCNKNWTTKKNNWLKVRLFKQNVINPAKFTDHGQFYDEFYENKPTLMLNAFSLSLRVPNLRWLLQLIQIILTRLMHNMSMMLNRVFALFTNLKKKFLKNHVLF